MFSSPVLLVWAVAWLLLALIADWPRPGPVALRQIMRVVVEVLALVLILLWPQVSLHFR